MNHIRAGSYYPQHSHGLGIPVLLLSDTRIHSLEPTSIKPISTLYDVDVYSIVLPLQEHELETRNWTGKRIYTKIYSNNLRGGYCLGPGNTGMERQFPRKVLSGDFFLGKVYILGWVLRG